MSQENWPPKLKTWVATCLGQMSDSNRKEGQAEMRKVIADAYESKALWTTDWDAVQLQSLPPPASSFINGLKRKPLETTTHGKKAKKSHTTASSTSSTPRSLNYDHDQSALNRRAQRFSREHQIERDKESNLTSSISALSLPSSNGRTPDPSEPENLNWENMRIVGTSTELFKDYLRLTSEPQPEKIRPLHVLETTLNELKKRWRGKETYNWMCSQLKSMRQDLTVQHIKNPFTVKVYELHARVALESNDMVEYNACQASLKPLYEKGIPGNVEEFTAYRILMLIHGRNKSEINYITGQLTPQQRSPSAPAIHHAIRVHRALSSSNYHELFALYQRTSEKEIGMGGYIMDQFIDRERVKALLVMTKAYKTLSLSFLEKRLGFDSAPHAAKFLSDHEVALDAQNVLDCTAAASVLRRQFEEKYTKVSIKGRI
ncbi:SAC3/GANP/Nin1/mts3/eIF-3 p25 family-domain-containing protein [Pterulicium gracile]|uniref:SAC3/GANP/Nin1/mts3/eIF-3 p25 family-domain-containing protein n=1 Tax=Pterulicium gracile TaxID=1884261 RepID=A0A5C3Q6W7_9AGAR|nr:SAC3/GANP/Nin1/mts3/eIF-3 p25 family-domain-containing protein [Pterula gracilis]